jgi:hypothetical protein
VLLAGCASDDIRARFASLDKYQELSCAQIAAEGERISQRVDDISARSAGGQNDSPWLLPPAIAVHWPAEPPGDESTAELSGLKAEFEALRQRR